MNNEILEKIEKYYNNGGFYNAPNVSNAPNTANNSPYMPMVTAMNTSTGWYVPPIIVEPKLNTVELEVNETINTDLICKSPGETEEYVRRELARRLAEKLIEEDLIRTYADRKIESGETEFRAIVKVVQE